MPRPGGLISWLIVLWSVSALLGADIAFEYPSALLDAYDADESCWVGMGLSGEYPTAVVPEEWLVGPPPSPYSAVTMPTDHWVHLLFSGELVRVEGDDLEIIETGAAGEEALVFLTDGADQEYPLGIARADDSGAQLHTFIGMDHGAFPGGFVPRGLRIVALDRGGAAPGFDLCNVRAWVSRECGPEALYPDPSDKAVGVPLDTTLTWVPACGTDTHRVYFGTNALAVLGGASEVRYDVAAFHAGHFDPGLLKLGRKYYWRVEEANSADANDVKSSDLWSFTMTDRILIDDFEAYQDWDHPLQDSWQARDLGRASIETNIFHSCRQAMAFGYYYDNYYEGSYSELYHHFDRAQDWTRAGIEVLEFWLHGKAGNATGGRMYVALNDGQNERIVTFGSDTDLLTTEQWQACRIALTDFAGVNLSRVRSLAIGIWRDLDLPLAHGSGMVYLDDISLRPRLCRQDRRSEADLNADCVIDYRDIEKMALQWLDSRVVTSSVAAPNEPVLWYKFDGDALDSAGNAHGQIEGRPTFVPGRHGRAIHFANDDDLISVSQPASVFGRIREAITISFWQKGDDTPHRNVTICGSNYTYGKLAPSIAINLGCWRDPGQYRWDCGTPWSLDNRVAGHHGHKSEWTGRWNHWAFTKDSVAGKMEIYLNGVLYDSRSGTVTPIEGITSFVIGSGWYGRYNGLIDDFQIYDYALSAEEVAYLASDGTGVLEQATAPAADLDGNGRVDLADYAMLAAQWRDDQRWP